MRDLRRRGIVTKKRLLRSGKAVGGIPFSRGPLQHLLRNRFYVGEVTFKDEILPGEQAAILDRDLFDAVQAKLNAQVRSHKDRRHTGEALLAGRLFDDSGQQMTPSHTRKRGRKYRYYISSALVQGKNVQTGSLNRVPANDIETLVAKSIREHLGLLVDLEDRAVIERYVMRVSVHPDRLSVELSHLRRTKKIKRLEIPWRKPPSKRRREILLPESVSAETTRPIRSENRAVLVNSIAKGRLWLNELVANSTITIERIADRERCSVRKVNQTISLAFLAPDLVKAALEGRLPYGMSVRRLRDLPPEWSRQYRALGLAA
jgi:site-specific DNA recombinase